jgi:hypothetical protein
MTKARHDAHIHWYRMLNVFSLRIIMSAGTCHHTHIPLSPTILPSPDCPSSIPNATSHDPRTQHPSVSPTYSKKQKCSNKNVGNVKYLATPLTKLLGPVFKLL